MQRKSGAAGKKFTKRKRSQFRIQQHPDAAFHGPLAGAGVIVHADQQGVRQFSLEGGVLPLAENMSRQAAKGLDAEDFPVPEPGPGRRLGGDEPPVGHGAV